METNVTATPDASKRRRVGTFTFGIVLVFCGTVMLVSMFFPDLDLLWVLKLSPLALVSLGVEVLLAARKNSPLKYDWVGMLLCFLVISASLVLFTAAWWIAHRPDNSWGCQYSGSREGTAQSLVMNYDLFHGEDSQPLELEVGDTLEMEIFNRKGTLDITLVEDENQETVYTEDDLFQTRFGITIPKGGTYELRVYGNYAQGRASFCLSES